jgi:hypothetical protein
MALRRLSSTAFGVEPLQGNNRSDGEAAERESRNDGACLDL